MLHATHLPPRLCRDDPSLPPLYRGFFIEGAIVHADREMAGRLAERLDVQAGREASKGRRGADIRGGAGGSVIKGDVTAENENEEEAVNGGDGVPHLMLKMKFLLYKLRTFLLRNNLGVLLNQGRDKYREAYSR